MSRICGELDTLVTAFRSRSLTGEHRYLWVDVMAAALIGRLVHHCHLVTIRGNSYRLRQHTELWQTLHTNQEPEPAARRRRARQEAPTN